MKRLKFFCVTYFILIMLVTLCKPALAGEPHKVLILPFDIHSEKDLSFLRNGIEDMLSTRLALEGKIVLINKSKTHQAIKDISEPINEKTAITLGERLKADYVLFGSLTVFGESISTDTRFVDVYKKKPVVTFNQFGKDHGDVIYHINLFAGQVNDQIFGRKTHTYQPAQEKEAVPVSRRHPEKLWTGDTGGGITDYYGIPGTEGKNLPARWKSRNFKTQITGMSVGDVDGDGKNEIVFISSNKVFIYRFYKENFIKVGEIQGKTFDEFIGVDVADINQNGKSEIFVTNLFHEDRIRSFVLESNGGEFSKIAERENWYYRVINLPVRGNILLGQKRGVVKPFAGSVYELIWENGRYVPGDRQVLPKSMNVYGFTYANLLSKEKEMIIAFTSDEYIRILDKTGNEEWKSSERFGGSPTYIEFSEEFLTDTIGDVKEMGHFFLPQRIHVADIDKDGKNEVIVVKNEDSSGHIFSRLRMFKSGHIECFTWDSVGLFPKWKTRSVSKYISDYAIADVDNDGKDELVFSVVARKSSVVGQAKSFIVSQDIY